MEVLLRAPFARGLVVSAPGRAAFDRAADCLPAPAKREAGESGAAIVLLVSAIGRRSERTARNLPAMAASFVTALRRPSPDPGPGALDFLRSWAAARMPNDGHVAMTEPDLCLYRFSTPTTFEKAATFGLTVGVVLDGEKRLRVGGHELIADPDGLLVITRETQRLVMARTGPRRRN